MIFIWIVFEFHKLHESVLTYASHGATKPVAI